MPLVMIIGANNPHTPDPRYALSTTPSTGTGYKLWQLLRKRQRVSAREYELGFDRRNLCKQIWDDKKAQEAAAFIREHAAGRSILLLGIPVKSLMAVPGLPLIHPVEAYGATWRFLPHPSGKNRWYNSPVNRLLASVLLEQLFLEGRDGG